MFFLSTVFIPEFSETFHFNSYFPVHMTLHQVLTKRESERKIEGGWREREREGGESERGRVERVREEREREKKKKKK